MSETSQGPEWWQASDGKWYPPEQAPGYAPPATGYTPPVVGSTPATTGYGYPVVASATGPLGRPERIGMQILWSVLTLGLYGIYWAYKCHDELKQHTGDGVGGALGAVIYFFVGIITLFLLPIEIQKMYERDGRESPVSAVTAFWILLFGIPWYVKCQRALNDYWIAKGAPPPV